MTRSTKHSFTNSKTEIEMRFARTIAIGQTFMIGGRSAAVLDVYVRESLGCARVKIDGQVHEFCARRFKSMVDQGAWNVA